MQTTTVAMIIDKCNQTDGENEMLTCAPPIPGMAYFADVYKTFHSYFSCSVCVFGIWMNLMTIVVLNNRSMRTPTNMLLTGIAVADSTTMITYLAYSLYVNIFTSAHPCTYPHTRAGIVFLLTHNALTITSHTVSTVLVVSLALVRCVSIYHQSSNVSGGVVTMRHAGLIILAATLASIIFCLPINIFYSIDEYRPGHYWFDLQEWAVGWMNKFNFIMYGCFVKILASILITILSTLLLLALNRAQRLHRRLKTNHAVTDDDPANRDNQRTTVMLVVVVVSFVITEFPQGILNTIVAHDRCFLYRVYVHIGDLMDTLVLLNSSINFCLYCAMSKQFRETFKKVFLSRLLSKNAANKHHQRNQNNLSITANMDYEMGIQRSRTITNL